MPAKITTSAAFAAIIGIGSVARAQVGSTRVINLPQSGSAPAAETKENSPTAAPLEWYGYQTLITDGLSIGLFGLAFATATKQSDGWTPFFLTLSGGGPFLIGAPIVHAANGQYLPAVGSLGMRIAMAYLGVGVGAAFAPHCVRRGETEPDCSWTARYPLAGLMVAAATTAAIDASLLAFKPAASPATARGTIVSTTPWFATNAAGLMINGTF